MTTNKIEQLKKAQQTKGHALASANNDERAATCEALIDTKEAARRLGLMDTTLEMWRVRGCGPQYLKIGRLVKYRASDVEGWLESRERQSTSEGQ
jgi:predicted DNA-binding transcriptional regulator AlpA